MLQGSNKDSKMRGWKEILFSYQLVQGPEADQFYSSIRSVLGQIKIQAISLYLTSFHPSSMRFAPQVSKIIKR